MLVYSSVSLSRDATQLNRHRQYASRFAINFRRTFTTAFQEIFGKFRKSEILSQDIHDPYVHYVEYFVLSVLLTLIIIQYYRKLYTCIIYTFYA